MRQREHVLDARDERVPPALGDGVALGDRARAALVADVPGGELRLLADLDLEPGAHDLGPRVRLVPVHPSAAELDVEPAPSGAVQVRPPSRSRASRSSVRAPRSAVSRAAVTPAKPPPTTTTSSMNDRTSSGAD